MPHSVEWIRAAFCGAALAASLHFAGAASAEVVNLLGEPTGAHALSALVEEQARAQSASDAAQDAVAADSGGEKAAVGFSSPVPEPGAWALIMLGFVGVALGVYRRRKPRLAALD